MNIKTPDAGTIPELKKLWQQAFGDTPAFIDGFFATGFSPDRCRCVTREDRLIAALYWFDCTLNGEKWAYLYAVATEESCRGQGICAALLRDTHRHLQENGYAGAVLTPANAHLWDYYGKFGYSTFGGVVTETVLPSEASSVAEITPGEYTLLRAAYLPENALDQRSVYGYYATWGGFYRCEYGCFAAAWDEETLYVQEFLGDEDCLPGVLAALGAKKGVLRRPGGSEPCGMYLKFRQNADTPGYLGFPLM